MNKTVYEKGIEKGIEKGRRESLRDQIEERFGPLPPAVLERLEAISLDQVRSATRDLSRASSLKDLGLSDE